jgi:hypothetical protein
MEKLLRVMACVVLLGALYGCAAQRPMLNEQTRAKLGSTDVVLQVNQEEIYAQIEHSKAAQYGGGGLILALIDVAIDHSRASTAEKAVEPYRNALVNYDFRAKMQAELEKSLAGPGFSVRSIKRLQPATKSNSSPEPLPQDGSLLQVTSRYSFTPDFSAVVVAADAVISVPQDGKAKIVHYQTYFVSKPAPAGTASMQDKWTANDGAALRIALDEGVVELVGHMHNALSVPGLQARQ